MSRNKKRNILILAFIIPVIMMGVVSFCLKLAPFGDGTILVSDLNAQFIDYYSYFKSIFTSNNNFIYTFSKSLGGDMVGFSGYYLQNPLLFLLFLFPEDLLPVGVLLMITVQTGLAGLSFAFMKGEMKGYRYDLLIFSIAYAFMGYLFSYITLPIYFCNIALLPLVILGLWHVVRDEKGKWLYVISLSLSVFFNYYLGYMLCLFSVLMFLYLFFIQTDGFLKIRQNSKVVISYVSCSALGVGLVAFDLIPIALSLRGQKSAPGLENLQFYRNFRMTDVFSRLYTNSFDGNISNDSFPYIYVGMTAVVFVLFFLLDKRQKKKERIAAFACLGIMLGCFYIHTVDVIWHAFNDPVGFPYRYAFFFSFLMLFFAEQGFDSLMSYEKKEKRVKIFLGLVLTLYVLYSIYLLTIGKTTINLRNIAFSAVAVILIVCAIYLFLIEKINAKVFLVVLLFVQVVELGINAGHSIAQYEAKTLTEYKSYIDKVSPMVEAIKKKDDSFYRIEKNFLRTHNDTMQFQYNGLSHSSSCEKDYVKNFMGRMGFRNFGLWSFYNEGGTSFADSFLGVKYYISKYNATGKPYELFDTINECTLYKNPYAMPIAFGVSNDVTSVDMEQADLFQIQNEIASLHTKGQEAIYTRAKVEKKTLHNVVAKQEADYITYTKEQEGEAYIEYLINITDEDNLYIYFGGTRIQGAEIRINDYSYGDYFTNWKWDMIDIGAYPIGEQVSIKLVLKEDSITADDGQFYYENKEQLKKWYEKASSNAAQLRKISSSHLDGTVDITDSNYLLFSIPFEEDWKIILDGKSVQGKEMLNALLAVEIMPGTHHFEMYYIPQGFYVGLTVSILCIIIGVGMLLYMRKCDK
ncbi:MAG: YfhO family protein [Clostridia bacterium]|nr:YfhO family protein [Clostridia bacterium]